jgi:hypothetical protein
LDDGVNPPENLEMAIDRGFLVDRMLRGISMRLVTDTHSIAVTSGWTSHEPIDVLAEVVVHFAIGVTGRSVWRDDPLFAVGTREGGSVDFISNCPEFVWT